jgi:RNA polymerase sigma-70 factor (ECF subfamily)
VLGDQFSSCLGRAQAGDEDAFARLFRDLAPVVIRYLRVVSSTAAEDLAAETWLEVVRGLRKFSGNEAGFRAWVLTIARHRHVDRLRSLARRPHEVQADPSLLELSSAEDTVAAAEEDLSTEAALSLIAALPPAQAEVVFLRAVVNLSVAEVASLVGHQPGAVRVMAHRGLRRLEQLLATRASEQERTR